MSCESNPRAFPYVVPTDFGFAHPGMELRDFFAAQCLGPLVASSDNRITPELVAQVAYQVADAMLAARQEKQP